MKTPQVTIGMPVFNDVKFIRAALDSLLNQTFKDFVLIISDDGSTDGSESICREFASKDLRIKYIRQPRNLGISRNMKFLLNQAKTDYFMWAANDDLWHEDFIKTLVKEMDENKNIISAFCPMYFIDEDDNKLEDPIGRSTDYSGNSPYIRLEKLINIFDDCFGYGLFRTEQIRDVEFPVWWWVNKNCPYNNIYPTLCYYLSRGDFKLALGKELWYNRLKKEENINHKIPYTNSYIRGTSSFILRKFNLVFISLINCYKGSGSLELPLRISFQMFTIWFVRPSFGTLKNNTLKLLKGEKAFF
jgi:glycosyltransferase involved in cell wall biosynthesis